MHLYVEFLQYAIERGNVLIECDALPTVVIFAEMRSNPSDRSVRGYDKRVKALVAFRRKLLGKSRFLQNGTGYRKRSVRSLQDGY